MNLKETLEIFKFEYSFTVKELCYILHKIPKRTMEDWLSGRRFPPEYIKFLIRDKIRYLEEEEMLEPGTIYNLKMACKSWNGEDKKPSWDGEDEDLTAYPF